MNAIRERARKILRDAPYAVEVRKVAGGYDVSYPGGDRQRWRIDGGGDEIRVVEEVSGEEMYVPGYAAHVAVSAVVQVNAGRLGYDPGYIFYVDEGGEERGDFASIATVDERFAERYDSLADILEESLRTPSYKYLRKLAEIKGVVEGFDLYAAIINPPGNEEEGD